MEVHLDDRDTVVRLGLYMFNVLTVVVIARSQTVTKRFSISSAATPE